MGFLRGLSRPLRARIAVFVGVILVAVGVGYMFGLGPALIVGGAAVIAYACLLYDVDEKPTPL